MSALIRFSAGRNKYDNAPRQLEVQDFAGLVKHLESHLGHKKGENYICGPMDFGPHNDATKYPDDAYYRLASLAAPCSFLSLDIDYMAGQPVQQLVLSELEKYVSYAYETASSTDEEPRMRVVIALDREVSRDERITLGEEVHAQIEAKIEAKFGSGGIKFDKSVYRPEQPNYNPLKGARTWKFLSARP